jgi:prenyltransferase beta subunit
MTASEVPAQALARARAYLRGRQCADGGFSFYRSEYLEEPNAHDTWHALAALRLLGAPAPKRDDMSRFVLRQALSEQPYALYFRVRSLNLLGSPDPEHTAVRAAVVALATPISDLEQPDDPADVLYRLQLVLWLKRHFDLACPAKPIIRALLAYEHPAGGFGDPPNLLATRQALAVLALCSEEPSAQTGAFVAGLATPGFGFRLTSDALATSLETTCAGVACCRRLDLPIIYADAALAFVGDCQTGDGGFARAPGALPNIGLTHLALAGLTALAGSLSH